MATIKLAHNATLAQLVKPPAGIADLVSELLSYRVDGADHMFSVGSGAWDGRSSFYEFTNNTFPAGFVYLVHAELTRLGHSVQLIRRPHHAPLGPENPIVDAFGNDDPRYDFQMQALRQVEKHGRGIIQVATGGGKSKIAKLVMARFKRMTLFLTTRGILLYQMDAQLKELGMATGLIGDGEFRPVRGVNLGMVQTFAQALDMPELHDEVIAVIKSSEKSGTVMTDEQIAEIAQKRLKEKTKKRQMLIKFLEMIEVVIGEEAHEAGGDSYFKILQHCKNASVRVALTATPFMRDSAADNMRLLAAFGSTLITVSEKLLIDRGILAKPYFKFVNSQPHPKLRRTSPFERAYTLGYIDNVAMHNDIVADAVKAKTYGLPVMTLIARKKHGDELAAMMKAAGLRVAFIKGENDMDARLKQLKALAKGSIDVLIGTTILDVGVDVPAIGLVQLAGGMKAEVSLRQRVGRGLRAKKGMANVAFIVDYTTNENSYLRDHYRQRRNIIENTPGFVEGILPDGHDFDWSIFAERKAA